MKRILTLLSLVLFSMSTYAQSAASYVSQGDKALKEMKESTAFNYYKKALKLEKKNLKALTGASLLCSRIGNRKTAKADKIAYFKAAKNYATRAVQASPKSSQANYVMAVAMGRMALISGSKDKVAASRNIKKYADLAVKYNPKHAEAWHVLGKYNFEVSNLNFAEKGAANLLFGGLPDGDLNTAIKYYLKSIKLNPKYMLNYYELARAYKEASKKAEAKAIIKKGMAIANTTFDDKSTKAKMSSLLKSL